MTMLARWALAATLTAAWTVAGCGDDAAEPAKPARPKAASKPSTPTPAGTTLKISALKYGNGPFRYDVRRLKAAAGPVTIEFVNDDTSAHNVRVQTGSKCCFGAENKDVGGTNTIEGAANAKATLTLKPGRYVFLCSITGHWKSDNGRMRGSLVIN